MKTALSLSAALALSLFAVGCDKEAVKEVGNKAAASGDKVPAKKAPKTKKVAPKPVVMNAALDLGAAVTDKDLTSYAGLKMMGPTGSTASYSDMGGLAVKWGELQFELRYEFDEEGGVAKGKAQAAKDGFNKLVKMHLDTPTAILWESKSALGDSSNFSFVATADVGGKKLLCKNQGYGQFSKAQAEALLKTCQSAKK